MGDINWKDKCFVATIYLVKDKKVMVTWNKNLQTWIPVGGHMDPGENPEEAVKREVAEETGFDFEFMSPHESDVDGNITLLRHHRVQLDPVPHHNQHMNFVFIGKCTGDVSKSTTDEDEKLEWFSRSDLVARKEEFLGSVYTMAMKALDVVG